MKLRSLVLLLGFSAIAGCVGAPPAVQEGKLPAKAPGRYNETVQSGVSRRYILEVPKAYDATRRLPLVVLLHGWTSSAERMMAYSGMSAKAEKEGFVLVAPEGLGKNQGWNAGFIDLTGEPQHPDDVAFVSKVMDQVEGEVGVDPDRVYVVGHSNGAMLSHLLSAKIGKRIAAFGAVAGTIGLPGTKETGPTTIPAPEAPVSAILLHGQADVLVSYDEKHPALLAAISAPTSARWWAERDGCALTPTHVASSDGRTITDTYSGGRNGTEVTLVTYPSGTHDWPRDGADIIWAFFSAHPRKR